MAQKGKFTGNLEKDFEEYLIESRLWIRYNESETDWINKIGTKMDQAAKRSAEENAHLKEDDYLWWVNLVRLQDFYGFDRDVFGEYLEIKGLTSQKNGQFFTPMQICNLLSALTEDNTETKGIKTVSDCCCGSGRMMIANASKKRKNKGYINQETIYYNQDIDYKSFVFTTLNASLRNLCSVNVWGNTLTVTENKVFVTVPTHLGWAQWFDKEHENHKLNNKLTEMEKFENVGELKEAI